MSASSANSCCRTIPSRLTIRFDVVNLFDKIYEIRRGSRHRRVRAAVRPAPWVLRRHLEKDITDRMCDPASGQCRDIFRCRQCVRQAYEIRGGSGIRGACAAIRPASWFLRRHRAKDMNDRMHSSQSDPPLGRNMNTSSLRAIHAVIFAVAMLVPASPSSAQQSTAAQQAPAASQPAAVPTQAAPTTRRRSLPQLRRLRSPTRAQPRRWRKAAEIDHGRAARIVAVVDVPVGGYPGQGGHDRARLRLARDMDDLHREDDRAVAGSGASFARRSA